MGVHRPIAIFILAAGCGGAVPDPCFDGQACDASACADCDHDAQPGAQRGQETTVQPSACSDDGECPADLPWCVEGSCRGCGSLGGDAYCRHRGAEVCTPWGHCGACDPAAAYGCHDDAPFCADDYQCGGCTRQSDCGDAGCDRGASRCLTDEAVVWVDAESCTHDGADGSADAPWCTLADALAGVGPDVSGTIHLVAAALPYPAAIVREGGSLVVVGHGDPQITADGDIVTVAAGARLTLHGVSIAPSDRAVGVTVAGGDVWLEDVRLVGGTAGLVARGGSARLHRARIEHPAREAIAASGSADVTLVDTAVVGAAVAPGAHAIDVADARVALRYCTIVANGAAPRTSVRCDPGGSVAIRASIVAGHASPSFDCANLQDEGSVLDHDGPLGRGSRAEPLWPAAFVDLGAADVHLSAQGRTAWAGVARWRTGDPLFDVDGDPRPGVDLAFEHPGVDQP